MVAYDYPRRYPDRVAAVGVVAAAYVSPCRARRAVPAVRVHRLIDMVLPFYGSYSEFLQRMMPSVGHGCGRPDASARAGSPLGMFFPGSGDVWRRPGWRGHINTTREPFAYQWRYER
jgi:hypothetical protein